MRVETFLDYNEILKVVFDIENGQVNYDIFCSVDMGQLDDNIVANLKNITVLENDVNSENCKLSINDKIFIDLNKTTGEIVSVNLLTSFETRLLAQGKTDKVPFARDGKNDFLPKTDLHTHLAGALTPESLLKVGLEHNIRYPAYLLEKAGIDIDKYEVGEDGNIELSSLSEEDRGTLKEHLIISPVTQETFNKMEEIYTLRGPFTKNKELFPDYLRELAKNYKEAGIQYAELSFSAFISDSEYLKMLEETLPAIEKETGVKIRFLAGLWRHSDQEWNLDDTDRIMKIARSPYIVGCDFMGHETNPTQTFAEELRMFARYAMREDPNFAIRVHAGENPMYMDNVRDALQIIYEEHAKAEAEQGKEMPMPRVRIGHGLYGVDDQVLALAKEMEAIIEFNMSSNLALNNINSIKEIPIKKYIDKGIDVVLGTDGHGLYSTVGAQEALLATAAGLETKDFDKIRETERKVIERAKEREKTHPRIAVQNLPDLYSVEYSTETGTQRYTKEVGEKYRREKLEKSEMIDQKLSSIGIVTDEEEIKKVTEGKAPIVLTGASENNWPNISPQDQEYIRITTQVLADVLNPETTYVITGGTNFGVEKTMHEAVHARNAEQVEPLVLLGTLTMEAAKREATGIKPDTITHATVLELDVRKASTWTELPETQLELCKREGGMLIAIGGGGIVNDMIQRGHNLAVDMHLMDGPYGASTNKSKSLKGNDYSFKTVEELLTRLYSRNPQLFTKEFSLDKIPEIIEKACHEVAQRPQEQDNSANFGLGEISSIDKTVTKEQRDKALDTLQSELQIDDKTNEKGGEAK